MIIIERYCDKNACLPGFLGNKREGVIYEKNLSTEEKTAQQSARVPEQNEHAERKKSIKKKKTEGQKGTDRLRPRPVVFLFHEAYGILTEE